MSKIFINSENSYTSGAYCVVLNLTNNLDLRTGDKLLRYQILPSTSHG